MARRISAAAVVGRELELDVLRAALGEARGGVSRSVVIGGEPGIGKSRLVTELAGIARADGWAVHAGACPPSADGTPVPYAPFGAVLRSIVRSVDARLLDHHLGPGRRDLAALLPELGDADPVSASGGGTARLFESILSLVERTARRGSGTVLVLEDLQWADAGARTLVAWLVQELRRVPVLMIVTHRTDLPPDDPLPPLLVELDRADGCERLELGPLSPADAERLLRALAGDAVAAPTLASIARRAGGVPLYLEELVSSGGASGSPPPSVRVAVARRLDGLDADATRCVQLAAVAGRPVEPATLARVAGLSADATVRCIASATDAGLLRAMVSAVGLPGEVAIRHGLVGEAVIALAPPGLAAAQHAAWAVLLRDRPDLAPTSPVERTAAIAGHLIAAGDRDAAVPALLAAADAATEARAFATADAGYARALELAGARLGALVPDPIAVLDVAARAAWLAGRPGRATELVGGAIARSGDAPGTDAALRRRTRLATYEAAAGRTTAAIADLEAVVALAPPGPTRIRALIELARSLTAAGDPAAGAARGRAALAEADAAGDRRAASRAGVALGVALSAAGDHAEAAAVLVEARRLDGAGATGRSGAASVSRLPDTLARHVDEATLLLHVGDLEGSLAAALRGRRIALDRGLTEAFGAIVTAMAAWDLVRLGRWAEADALLGGLPSRDDDLLAGAPAAVAAWLAAARGRWDEVPALLAIVEAGTGSMLPGADWAAIATAAATMASAGQGRLHAARDRLRAGLRTVDAAGAPSTVAGLALLGLSVEAEAADLARTRRDPAALDDALGAADELAARVRSAVEAAAPSATAPGLAVPAVRWQAVIGARAEAELARVRGTDVAADWERVIDLSDAAGDRWGAATARLRLATILLAGAGDRTRATAALTETVTVAHELGAAPVVVAAERLARRGRILLPTDAGAAAPGDPRAAAAALGLSAREVDVLELLAQGRTDREIAEQLFITEKTAGHHVSHILTKLGVSRRGEAAAIAHRIGLSADH